MSETREQMAARLEEIASDYAQWLVPHHAALRAGAEALRAADRLATRQGLDRAIALVESATQFNFDGYFSDFVKQDELLAALRAERDKEQP